MSCGYNTEDSSSSEMLWFPPSCRAGQEGSQAPKARACSLIQCSCLLSTTGVAVRTNWKTPWATGCWEPSAWEAVSEAAGHGAEHALCGAMTRQRHPIHASVCARCALTGPCPLRSNGSVSGCALTGPCPLRSNRSVPCSRQMEPRPSRPLRGGSRDWNRGQSAHQGCQPMSS